MSGLAFFWVQWNMLLFNNILCSLNYLTTTCFDKFLTGRSGSIWWCLWKANMFASTLIIHLLAISNIWSIICWSDILLNKYLSSRDSSSWHLWPGMSASALQLNQSDYLGLPWNSTDSLWKALSLPLSEEVSCQQLVFLGKHLAVNQSLISEECSAFSVKWCTGLCLTPTQDYLPPPNSTHQPPPLSLSPPPSIFPVQHHSIHTFCVCL